MMFLRTGSAGPSSAILRYVSSSQAVNAKAIVLRKFESLVRGQLDERFAFADQVNLLAFWTLGHLFGSNVG